MEINIKTAAFMLGTSEEMLHRWVRQGVIPVVETDKEVLFDEKALADWAAKRRMPVRRAAEAAPSPDDDNAESDLSLQAAMARGGVCFGVSGSDVRGVLSAAVDRLVLPASSEKEEVLDRLLAREALASTGIGGGIAIPHPRKPLEGLPQGGIIATCFLDTPVDFNAVDQKPVFVLFLMFSPSTKRHLELLSRLSFCLNNPLVSGILSDVKDEKTLLRAISEVEKEIQSTGV